MTAKKKKAVVAAAVILLLLVVDQLIKIWVKTHMTLGESILPRCNRNSTAHA